MIYLEKLHIIGGKVKPAQKFKISQALATPPTKVVTVITQRINPLS